MSSTSFIENNNNNNNNNNNMSESSSSSLLSISTDQQKKKPLEIQISCSDGVQLAAQRWLPPSTISTTSTTKTTTTGKSQNKILCLHGWLDNASSFHILAPKLHTSFPNADIVTLDFPGHGKSSHKSPDGPTQTIAEYALYVREALSSLGWIPPRTGTTTTTTTTSASSTISTSTMEKITIVGHSMGTGVALIYAAAFPEHVQEMVFLDGFGPLARNAFDISKHVRNAIIRRTTYNQRLFPQFQREQMVVLVSGGGEGQNNKSGNDATGEMTSTTGSTATTPKGRQRSYSNITIAVAARMKTAESSPGDQYISQEAAEALVLRALVKSPSTISPTTTTDDTIHQKRQTEEEEEVTSTYTGSVQFRHDPRLLWPNIQYYTHEQVESMYKDVQCPICLLRAQNGWPISSKEQESVQKVLQPVVIKVLPGSHHFHADPKSAEAVCQEVISFLGRDD